MVPPNAHSHHQALLLSSSFSLMVNLDVSSMIAWVSELTHGGHVFTYEDPILEEQAQQEKEHPVWAGLQEATQGGRGCRRLHRMGGAAGGYRGWAGGAGLSVLPRL